MHTQRETVTSCIQDTHVLPTAAKCCAPKNGLYLQVQSPAQNGSSGHTRRLEVSCSLGLQGLTAWVWPPVQSRKCSCCRYHLGATVNHMSTTSAQCLTVQITHCVHSRKDSRSGVCAHEGQSGSHAMHIAHAMLCLSDCRPPRLAEIPRSQIFYSSSQATGLLAAGARCFGSSNGSATMHDAWSTSALSVPHHTGGGWSALLVPTRQAMHQMQSRRLACKATAGAARHGAAWRVRQGMESTQQQTHPPCTS